MARLGDTRKRARSAGTGTTGAERHKVATTLCPTNVTVNPTRHATFDANTNVPAAIALIEENEDLSNDEFSDAAECITRNPMIATVYIAMSNQNSRSRYIRKQVDSYRGLEAA